MHATDAALVTEAAAALDVPEIAVFRRAWSEWYGAPPEEAHIEPPFVVYMFGGPAPMWVRAYARRVVAEHRRAVLDPRAWGVGPAYIRNPALGYLLAAASVLVLIVLVALADVAAQHLAGIEGCFTPPCYGSPD